MNHASFHFDLKEISEAGSIKGLAAGYGNIDSHGEIFAQGAFSKSIESFKNGGRKPAMLLHHDVRRPAGRWNTFLETPDGLQVEGQIAIEAKDGREAYALLKAGALAGLSVGFRRKDFFRDKNNIRVITDAELFEVSLVSTPSNPLTHVADVKAVGDVRELEDLLRSAGFSGREAKAAATAAWRTKNNQSDQDFTGAAAILAAANRSIADIFGSN